MEHLLSAPLYSGVPAISSNIRLDRKFFPGTNTIAYSVEDVSDERIFFVIFTRDQSYKTFCSVIYEFSQQARA